MLSTVLGKLFTHICIPICYQTLHQAYKRSPALHFPFLIFFLLIRCYVGPTKTQWRKCNDRYYPYINHFVDHDDHIRPPPYPPSSPPKEPWNSVKPPLPSSETNLQPTFRPGFRPDRPPPPSTIHPPKPSLDQYEEQFQNQFLDPPKPGGFGQPRHWPVAYLHKESPFNESGYPALQFASMKQAKTNHDSSKVEAIENLINIIKSNDIDNVQYQIGNNKSDETLYVKIPLPTNFTTQTETSLNTQNKDLSLARVDVDINNENRNIAVRENKRNKTTKAIDLENKNVPIYRRGYVTKTNVTSYEKRWANVGRGRTEYRIVV